MSKQKGYTNFLFIIFESIKIYFSNIDKFFMYMLFPVFGQILGISLSFGLSLGFADRIADKTNSVSGAILMVLLLAAPGLLIFVKAFWDYMVAYVALNSMTEGVLSSGRVYDFQSHREVATRRTFKYMILLMIVGILTSVGSSIFFIVPGFIAWVYLILIFQVFTFEQDLSISECFKRSFFLVRGKWLQTVIIMIVLFIFSIFLIAEGITVIFDYLNLTAPICGVFDFIGESLELELVNKALVYVKFEPITTAKISHWIYFSLVYIIVSMFTLPIRSICWTLWYKNLVQLKDFSKKEKTEKKD